MMVFGDCSAMLAGQCTALARMCLVFGVLLLGAVPVFGQSVETRTPEEADRLYHEVGDQLFCVCGCREKLLSCSMNVCSNKVAEREYLRELCADPKLDPPQIREAMAKRFGPNVLQVPPESNLYPILIISGLLLIGAFSAGFWVLTRRQEEDVLADTTPVDPEMEDRIMRELKELD